MSILPFPALRWLHASVVIVWLWTAASSVLEWHGQSTQLLRTAGVTPVAWDDGLILGGAALDLRIGLWMWLRPGRPAYLAALLAMAGLTLMASVMQPTLWLHPLGPLSKNLPIAAALICLINASAPLSTNYKEIS